MVICGSGGPAISWDCEDESGGVEELATGLNVLCGEDRFSEDIADENADINGSSGTFLCDIFSAEIADENADIKGSSGTFRGEDVVVATCAPSNSLFCVLDNDFSASSLASESPAVVGRESFSTLLPLRHEPRERRTCLPERQFEDFLEGLSISSSSSSNSVGKNFVLSTVVSTTAFPPRPFFHARPGSFFTSSKTGFGLPLADPVLFAEFAEAQAQPTWQVPDIRHESWEACKLGSGS